MGEKERRIDEEIRRLRGDLAWRWHWLLHVLVPYIMPTPCEWLTLSTSSQSSQRFPCVVLDILLHDYVHVQSLLEEPFPTSLDFEAKDKDFLLI